MQEFIKLKKKQINFRGSPENLFACKSRTFFLNSFAFEKINITGVIAPLTAALFFGLMFRFEIECLKHKPLC